MLCLPTHSCSCSRGIVICGQLARRSLGRPLVATASTSTRPKKPHEQPTNVNGRLKQQHRSSAGADASRQRGRDHAFLAAFDRALRAGDAPACNQLLQSLLTGLEEPHGDSRRALLGALLRGRHQAYMRLLVAEGQVEDAAAYVAMLPPSRAFNGALLKACMEAGDLASLQQLIQACHRICSFMHHRKVYSIKCSY